MRRLELSPEALEDLRAVSRYSEREWGVRVKHRYMAALRDRMLKLRERPATGRKFPLLPGVRYARSGRHLVFYEVRDGRIQILRVLHERMDIAARLRAEQP